jgi:hypothetical protein
MSASEAPRDGRPRPAREPVRFGTVVVIGGGCYGSYDLRQLGRAVAAGALVCRRVLVVDRDAGCAVGRTLAAESGPGAPRPHDATPGAAAPQPFAAAGIELTLIVSAWADFVRAYLGGGSDAYAPAAPDDAIVPSPLMPHLLYEWLLARARERWPERAVATVPLRRPPATPWQRAAPDGTHYLSFAEWICPVNCIEPRLCPEVRGPRDWSMPAALAAYAREEREAGQRLPDPIVFHCTHRAYGVGMIDVRDVLAADERVAEAARDGPARMLVATASHCHGAANLLEVGPAVHAPFA